MQTYEQNMVHAFITYDFLYLFSGCAEDEAWAEK